MMNVSFSCTDFFICCSSGQISSCHQSPLRPAVGEHSSRSPSIVSPSSLWDTNALRILEHLASATSFKHSQLGQRDTKEAAKLPEGR